AAAPAAITAAAAVRPRPTARVPVSPVPFVTLSRRGARRGRGSRCGLLRCRRWRGGLHPGGPLFSRRRWRSKLPSAERDAVPSGDGRRQLRLERRERHIAESHAVALVLDVRSLPPSDALVAPASPAAFGGCCLERAELHVARLQFL